MTQFDVFNGDADGICALHQLRLAAPAESVLVTGLKRDVELLGRVCAQAGDAVTVLDVSADANRAALGLLLDRGVHVRYFDHHYAGELPVSPFLDASIDTSADTCTSLIVDRHLNGAHRRWAVVGAYGDNLSRSARTCADSLQLSEYERNQLRELGENLAYNAYGDREADVIVHPADLYRSLAPYADPLHFIRDNALCRHIGEQKRADLERAQKVESAIAQSGFDLYVLPDEAWARRARGILANALANRSPCRAHAVLTVNEDGAFTASLRAPIAAPFGADTVCRRFVTGGGRAAAAGINHLPRERLAAFAEAIHAAFPRPVDDPRPVLPG